MIPFFNGRSVPGKALVTNGDLVAGGSTGEWQAYETALNANGGHDSGLVIPVMGNHEYYGSAGSDTYKSRFLAHAKRSTVWTEKVVGGLPLLVLGSERYDYPDKTGAPPFVTFSETQLDWFEARMRYWKSRNTPALIFTHNVLPNSVTGTHVRFYRNDFGEYTERFKSLLQLHPRSILFTGHTHWSLRDPKWAVYYNIGGGKQIRIINTGSLANYYVASGSDGEKPGSGAYAAGLRVHRYSDHFVIEAWDFLAGTLISSFKHGA